jgi:hypothetical protein
MKTFTTTSLFLLLILALVKTGVAQLNCYPPNNCLISNNDFATYSTWNQGSYFDMPIVHDSVCGWDHLFNNENIYGWGNGCFFHYETPDVHVLYIDPEHEDDQNQIFQQLPSNYTTSEQYSFSVQFHLDGLIGVNNEVVICLTNDSVKEVFYPEFTSNPYILYSRSNLDPGYYSDSHYFTLTDSYKYIVIYYTTGLTDLPHNEYDLKLININLCGQQPLQLNPGCARTICMGDTVTLGGELIKECPGIQYPTAWGGHEPYTYCWTKSLDFPLDCFSQKANAVDKPDITTKYYIVVEDDHNTTKIDSVTITVAACISPLNVMAGQVQGIKCSGEIDTLGGNPSASGGTSPYIYSWTSVPAGFTSSLSNPTVTPFVTTLYKLCVTDNSSPPQTQCDSVLVTISDTCCDVEWPKLITSGQGNAIEESLIASDTNGNVTIYFCHSSNSVEIIGDRTISNLPGYYRNSMVSFNKCGHFKWFNSLNVGYICGSITKTVMDGAGNYYIVFQSGGAYAFLNGGPSGNNGFCEYLAKINTSGVVSWVQPFKMTAEELLPIQSITEHGDYLYLSVYAKSSFISPAYLSNLNYINGNHELIMKLYKSNGNVVTYNDDFVPYSAESNTSLIVTPGDTIVVQQGRYFYIFDHDCRPTIQDKIDGQMDGCPISPDFLYYNDNNMLIVPKCNSSILKFHYGNNTVRPYSWEHLISNEVITSLFTTPNSIFFSTYEGYLPCGYNNYIYRWDTTGSPGWSRDYDPQLQISGCKNLINGYKLLYGPMGCQEELKLDTFYMGPAPFRPQMNSDTISGVLKPAPVEENAFSVVLKPNPVKDFLHVNIKHSYATELELFNQFGVLIKNIFLNNNEYTLDFNGYEEGLYYLRVISDKSSIIKKIEKIK